MKTVHIYKAQPTAVNRPCSCDDHPEDPNVCPACQPESVTIVLNRAIPELPDTPTPPYQNVLDEARAIHQKEAAALADALQGSLPGGTFDALLVELMARKVTLFRVAHTPVEVPIQIKLVSSSSLARGVQYVETEAIETEDDGSTTLVVRAWREAETTGAAAKIAEFMERPGLGIFCTAARTEFCEKFPFATDDMLRFINYVARSAYELGRPQGRGL